MYLTTSQMYTIWLNSQCVVFDPFSAPRHRESWSLFYPWSPVTSVQTAWDTCQSEHLHPLESNNQYIYWWAHYLLERYIFYSKMHPKKNMIQKVTQRNIAYVRWQLYCHYVSVCNPQPFFIWHITVVMATNSDDWHSLHTAVLTRPIMRKLFFGYLLTKGVLHVHCPI